jgi:geranylgeranyl pyrophosphate synthase
MTYGTGAVWQEELLGLDSNVGLREVEAVLVKLAVGDRLDRVGAITQEHLQTGGKRMRARLALAAGEALGQSRERMVPWAAAVELLHQATLVHDDLQDGDTVRRDQPTVWAKHGVNQAVCVGDLLLMLPVLAIGQLQADGDVKFRLTRRLVLDAEATVRGQSRDLDLLASDALTQEDWGAAALGKSGALFGLPVAGAAILAGVDDRSAARIGHAFARIGVLYQAWDDLVDLWGNKGRGQVGNDLREGKVSAVVVEHTARVPADRAAIAALLRRGRDAWTDQDVRDTIARFEASGAREGVSERIEELERSVLEEPVLTSLPEVHAIASELVLRVRRTFRAG